MFSSPHLRSSFPDESEFTKHRYAFAHDIEAESPSIDSDSRERYRSENADLSIRT